MAVTSRNRQKFEDYDGFTGKFKPKKTTDDCYTPDAVYSAVLDWVRHEYRIGDVPIVRPFFPGGDYQTADYPDGCVVVDNPPFSMYAQIVRWYLDHGISFFLFAPSLTCLVSGTVGRACCIVPDVRITYANGARVLTAFITSLEPETAMRTAPELRRALITAQAPQSPSLPKYTYPDEIVTAAHFQRLCRTDYRIPAASAVYVGNIDAMRAAHKSLFGGGLLVSHRAAAERAAAERAAAERAAAERAAAERAAADRWTLSPREIELVDGLEQRRETASIFLFFAKKVLANTLLTWYNKDSWRGNHITHQGG